MSEKIVDIIIIVADNETVDEVTYPVTKIYRGECETHNVSAAIRGAARHTIDGLLSVMKSRDTGS